MSYQGPTWKLIQHNTDFEGHSPRPNRFAEGFTRDVIDLQDHSWAEQHVRETGAVSFRRVHALVSEPHAGENAAETHCSGEESR